MEVKSIFTCFTADEIRDIMSERALCVGGDGAGACSGDSGGGFFTFHESNWFLRGIISSGVVDGARRCNVSAQTVITNVEKFDGWIERIVNGGIQLRCDFKSDIQAEHTCYVYKEDGHLDIDNENTRIVQIARKNGEIVKNIDVTSLKILYIHLKFLPIKLGETFPNLQSYEIFLSELEKVTRRNFQDLRKLEVLEIRHNQLKDLPVDTFYDLTELREINLESNKIEAIDPDTFIKNLQLVTIVLSGNKLRFLDGATLRKNLNLRFFYINDNQLAYIGVKLLDNLEKLKWVGFNGNRCIDQHRIWNINAMRTIFLNKCQIA